MGDVFTNWVTMDTLHLFHKLPNFRSWLLNCSHESGVLPSAEGAAHNTFENLSFEREFGKSKVKEFQPCHVPNFKELGFKVGLYFLG